MRFGSEMRKARKHHGVSLRALAKLLGVSHVYLSKIERGLAMPSRKRVQAIEGFIGMRAWSLSAVARDEVGRRAAARWWGAGEVDGWEDKGDR